MQTNQNLSLFLPNSSFFLLKSSLPFPFNFFLEIKNLNKNISLNMTEVVY